MATYVVGDVQGCFATFQKLLVEIKFDEQVDQLILLGDVINRGPQSLAMLRYVKEHASSMSMVLGNHEIFAIALALDALKTDRAHTLHELFAASDKMELINFLRAQPFIRQLGDAVFVHAGIMPSVSIDAAKTHSDQVSSVLMSDRAGKFLRRYYDNTPTHLKPTSSKKRELRYALAYFTLLRMCESPARMDLTYSGVIDKAPKRLKPWFSLRNDETNKIFFGHWAALGFYKNPPYFCLDSGCAWGNKLTAMRLSDLEVFQVDNVDKI